MTNEQRLINKLLFSKKSLITTSAIIFLTLSSVKEVQAEDGTTDYEEEQITEVKTEESQQLNSVSEDAKQTNETELEVYEEQDHTGEKLDLLTETLNPLLNEEQNEAFISLLSENELFEEALLNHDEKEFGTASENYQEILTTVKLSEAQEMLLKDFNQLAEENKSLTDYTYEEHEFEEQIEEQEENIEEKELDENVESDIDESQEQRLDEEESEIDELEEQELDEEESEIDELEEQELDEEEPEVDELEELDTNEDTEVDETEEEASDDEADLDTEPEETDEDDSNEEEDIEEAVTEETGNMQRAAATLSATPQQQALTAEKDVDYRGYLVNASDKIYSQPTATPEFEIRAVDSLQRSEVKVKKEATVDQTDWLYIEVVGSQVSGWVNKTAVETETISSEKDTNYRGYLARTNDTINTQPWGTPGYEEIRRVQDLKGKEVKVLKEAQTQRATWLYIDVIGANISGWIDKAGIDIETVSTEKDINYRGYLARTNDTINTQPWGTPGYEEIRRVQDLQGKEVKVLKEAQTQRATWLYVDVLGSNVSGWIDKAGIDIETISSQRDVNYRGYLARTNDTINTQPWGTPGYEEIRRVRDLQGKEVKVLKEAETQRATWLYIEVVGSNVAGWVDKSGVEAETIATQENVNYRGYLSRSNDTINTQPWGVPGYEEIRRVQDLKGKEVKVLRKAQTQRANWLYVEVVGANVAGWIDQAGVEEEAITSQKTVDYRGFLTRPTDTINSQPWGVPGYQQLRKVNDLEGQEVQVTKEATTQRANWAYINVVGTDISGWIDKAGVTQASVAYRMTYYNRTFEEALDLQMQYGYPQTDLYGGGWQHAKRSDVAYYLNPENFVNSKNGSTPTNIESVQIATAALNVRTGPSAGYSRLTTVSRNEVYDVIDEANGWYKIDLNGSEGWVSGNYVSFIGEVQYGNLPNNQIATITASALNVRKGPSVDYQVETLVYSNESYEVLDYSNGWYKIAVAGTEGWVSGSYVNVSENIPGETLQFLSLSSPSGITEADLNKELKGKGILENQGAAFIEASKRYNINEIYLLSHALLETGHGTSELATGVRVNGVTVYNMFGIGAYDGQALEAGSRRAYEEGWDTPAKAIIGGAEFIANSYINNPAHKQDTLYKMKWNPAKPSDHQYATDIGWAVKQTRILDKIIELSNTHNLVLKFDIPIYK